MSKINIGTIIDLDDLVESRMLIQANSGGGKSGIARVIMATACYYDEGWRATERHTYCPKCAKKFLKPKKKKK